MTSQEPAEWYIFLSKENPDAFTIQLVTTALDVDLYVGTNDANLHPGCRSSRTGHTSMEIFSEE
ncbi:hypothetical protein K443DRAFT_740 [Laccaria amethystina LaAM-08-1]|uniref:Uncharacterized protein n=1 Tax=Laccaria amethystina LaAM-08-1 TaxID=1095629 RepID=A0A0C9XBL2_9AGAR|nr:hypothetical protein K443DRAFT_740 [Laccaria amethystina LaAM-08-1]